MKITHYIYIGISALSLAACGDYNDNLDGYTEEAYKPKDIKKLKVELSGNDYELIGTLSGDNSIKTNKFIANADDAKEYIPLWLKSTYPTADNGSTASVTYKQRVEKNDADTPTETIVTTETITSPFVLLNSVWKYDPSMTITLPKIKRNPESVQFYQAACDWVWNNIDIPANAEKGKGYVSKYGNNEFYTGSSAYDCCVDWTPAKAKAQCPDVYGTMTDLQIKDTMAKNLIDVYANVLAELYQDAKAVEGIQVIYTINFTVIEPEEKNYTIQYTITDENKFQYVPGSLTTKK